MWSASLWGMLTSQTGRKNRQTDGQTDAEWTDWWRDCGLTDSGQKNADPLLANVKKKLYRNIVANSLPTFSHQTENLWKLQKTFGAWRVLISSPATTSRRTPKTPEPPKNLNSKLVETISPEGPQHLLHYLYTPKRSRRTSTWNQLNL